MTNALSVAGKRKWNTMSVMIVGKDIIIDSMTNEYRPEWKILRSYFDERAVLYSDEQCDLFEGLRLAWEESLYECYGRISRYDLENIFGIERPRQYAGSKLSKEEVLERLDILKFFSSYTNLTRRSNMDFKGLCPLHKENTPSFSLNPEKGLFYCFGEAIGGDIFTFIMLKHEISFLEALNFLREKIE